MLKFVKLYQSLDQTTKQNEKVQLLVNYFSETTDSDKLWVIALFTGNRPKRIVKISTLKKFACEYTHTPDWLFDESYAVVGDLAETIALLIQHKTTNSNTKSLTHWILDVKLLANLNEEDQKTTLFQYWDELDNNSVFILNKLLTGGFRIGISKGLLISALSKSTGILVEDLYLRLTGKWSPDTTDIQQLLYASNTHLKSLHPYPYCLATTLSETEKIKTNFDGYQIELKWDGIRAQIIKRGPLIAIWSRGEELISESFPEIMDQFSKIESFNGVIDGEIICWDFINEIPLSFNHIQKRIGRKKPGKKTLADYPVVFIAYDLLELNGLDIRNEFLSFRRKQMENEFNLKLFEYSNLRLSQILHLNQFKNIQELMEFSKQKKTEGLILKEITSKYEIGRKKGIWWKWKHEAETVDAVLLYAQKGHGNRANVYSDFTFGIEKNGELVPFAKAYSGLSKIELMEVSQWINKNTINSFGPVKSVKAELVFEIAFEGIAESPRHKSGVSVRFPRIICWRKDKNAQQITKFEDLQF